VPADTGGPRRSGHVGGVLARFTAAGIRFIRSHRQDLGREDGQVPADTGGPRQSGHVGGVLARFTAAGIRLCRRISRAAIEPLRLQLRCLVDYLESRKCALAANGVSIWQGRCVRIYCGYWLSVGKGSSNSLFTHTLTIGNAIGHQLSCQVYIRWAQGIFLIYISHMLHGIVCICYV
jgi:hypothetical protein